MKVVERATRFYTEQDGQWYKVVTATIAHSTLERSNETEVWEALEQAGFKKGTGAMTSEQDVFMRDSTYCQTIPVSRQEVDEDCLEKPQLRNGTFKTVEEMRQWMRNGCPI